MRHQKIKKMLSEYVDDRLSSNEEKFMREHLAHCIECNNVLKAFQQLDRFYVEPNARVNPFFAQRVLAHLKARRLDGFWQVFDFIPRPIIVTGLALSLITLTIFSTPLHNFATEKTSSELAVLYADSNEQTPVTDDQALALVFDAQEINATGE